ncbi:MAG: ribosome silencing factor [Flavobacteriales bacterium]|nr:ribosome silencing factor [Flavobacteriales bacterium]|tara:strand:- start:15936 stop:16313 length:378 start_codon:yes stop_codon:yes gene_type:complete
MSKKKMLDAADILANVIIEGMQENKAKEIVSLNLKEIETAVCDYFIICHGTSNTHVSAIADSVIDETIKTLKDKPFNKEGLENGEWILLDYGNVVAHVFQRETRDFYNIEKLWGDADIDHIKDIV